MPTQITLVSLYGEKSKELATAIAQCQELLTQAVGSAFTPYGIRQIHATIIGLERYRAPAYNANFFKHRRRDVEMNIAGFLAYLRGCGHIPFKVQLGGFADRDYPFTSSKARPYERSFSIQDDKVVVMGWPVRAEYLPMPPATPGGEVPEARIYPATLEIIRHAAQGFGILHSYHREVSDVDNDLFFRIGMIDTKAVTSATTSALENQARQLLSLRHPVIVEIGFENSFIAAYEDDRLPVSSTRIWSLADLRVDDTFAASLFA